MNTDPDALLASIVRWAEESPNIVTLILTGSRARLGASVDEFSDLDVEVIADDPTELIRNDAWLSRFGRIWVYLPAVKGQRYETRLVFYEGGTKVDFSLCGRERLSAMVEAQVLDDLYERGHRVLVDKAGITSNLPPATGEFPGKRLPGQEEFAAVVNEFWFEAAHIPRYLLRDELWVAKFRDWTMKTLLLTMLEWHAIASSDQNVDVWHIGTHMMDWVDEATWNDIHTIFSGFDARESWHGLLATARLFRRLARETAAAADLEYPAEADKSISGYIAGFEDRISSASSNRNADLG